MCRFLVFSILPVFDELIGRVQSYCLNAALIGCEMDFVMGKFGQ